MNGSSTEKPKCPVTGAAVAEGLLTKSLIDAEVFDRPSEYYSALRRDDPVHYDEKLGMYLVSRYEELNAILRDTDSFAQRLGWDDQFGYGYLEELKSILERDGGGFFPETLLLDPPEHTRIRRLSEKAFTAHRVKQLEPAIERIVADVIEPLAEKGGAEGVLEIASPITVRIMCEQLGLDYEEIGHKVVGWSNAYVAQIGRMQSHAEMLENAQKICEMQNYIIERVREHQTNPREDMISDLINARLEDDENPTLSFDELVATTRGFLNAGNETTSLALRSMLFMLATHPELAEELSGAMDDDIKLGRFVEELLRLEPPARGLARTTTQQVELGGKTLPAGTQVLLLFGSANVDEAVFECARDFDPSRKNLGRHLTFGAGIHRCVGMSLARMELKVAARAIMRRLKDIRLAVPAEEIRYRPGIAHLAIESLPLTFARRG